MSEQNNKLTKNEYSLDHIFSNISSEDKKLKSKKSKVPFKFLDSYILENYKSRRVVSKLINIQ